MPRDDDLPADEADFDPELDASPDAMPMADDRDMDYYIRALDSGALTPIFAHAPWGEMSLRYEALGRQSLPPPPRLLDRPAGVSGGGKGGRGVQHPD